MSATAVEPSDESSWRAIMEHFAPAVQLGLTATPKRDVNGDTYDYFGEPVYEYSLKAGINDGFLSPFRLEGNPPAPLMSMCTHLTITWRKERLRWDGNTPSLTSTASLKSRNAKHTAWTLFMNMIDQGQKALVFCATQRHALAVRDLINQKASTYQCQLLPPRYCR